MPKVLTLTQLLKKKYKYLEGLPENIVESFGKLTYGFPMIIWGESGNGKSNLVMQLLSVLMQYGNVLMLALEEGHKASTQKNVSRHLSEAHAGKIKFADHEMTFGELQKLLRKKKSPKIIVVDSIQYWDITYDDYKSLKEEFRNKIFIFTSHANGKIPDGKTANKVRYDSDIKVRVEGYIAFVASRFGGNKPYVIWEEGAKVKWGKEYKKIVGRKGIRGEKNPKGKNPENIIENAENTEV